MSDKANINPKVLRWARESARFSLEGAAGKVSVTPERLTEWEEGISQPTIVQAEKLAKTYRRPFALFFFPNVPQDFEPLQDFRRKDARILGTGSAFIIREIQQKQAWIKEFYVDNNEAEIAFVGRFTANTSSATVAQDIWRELNIQPGQYTANTPIREWIDKAEAKGIFISRTSFIHTKLKLDSEELQGFAIADPLAPFVFINSEDWDAPQLFTLVHELAHIWIAASGISGDIEPEMQHRDKLDPIELFCNAVAAQALMPEHLMRQISVSIFDSYDRVFTVARRFGVSSFALLYRAYSLALISVSRYRSLKQQADDAFRQYVQQQELKKLSQKEKEGGPNYFRLLINKNSVLFTKIVLDAFRGGSIPPTQASSLLNTQVNKFPKMEAFLYA